MFVFRTDGSGHLTLYPRTALGSPRLKRISFSVSGPFQRLMRNQFHCFTSSDGPGTRPCLYFLWFGVVVSGRPLPRLLRRSDGVVRVTDTGTWVKSSATFTGPSLPPLSTGDMSSCVLSTERTLGGREHW